MLKKQESIIKNYFKENPGITAVYLFGSFADGREVKDSDIDIAILLNHGELSFKEKTRMTLDLNQLTDREIDLIDLKNVSSILQMQVLKKGKCLFCNNENKLNQFKIKTVQTYLDLKKVRKPIEDRLKDVTIYG